MQIENRGERMKTMNPHDIKDVSQDGITIAVDKRQYELLRAHHFGLLEGMKPKKARARREDDNQRALRMLLFPPSQEAYENLIKVIDGKYQILDSHGKLVTMSM